MISASHNPYADNGVKFFAAGGRKLSDEVEEELEAVHRRAAHRRGGRRTLRPSRTRRRVVRAPAARRAGRPPPRRPARRARLRQRRGLARRARGASGDAGARVDVIHDEPDGTNINDGCGSTHPEDLQRAVVERGADVGLAFDGDADRVLAVDGDGSLVDGDHIIAICAIDLHARGGSPTRPSSSP